MSFKRIHTIRQALPAATSMAELKAASVAVIGAGKTSLLL
jgi:hypothetical protein